MLGFKRNDVGVRGQVTGEVAKVVSDDIGQDGNEQAAFQGRDAAVSACCNLDSLFPFFRSSVPRRLPRARLRAAM